MKQETTSTPIYNKITPIKRKVPQTLVSEDVFRSAHERLLASATGTLRSKTAAIGPFRVELTSNSRSEERV